MTAAKQGHNKGDQNGLGLSPMVHFHIKS